MDDLDCGEVITLICAFVRQDSRQKSEILFRVVDWCLWLQLGAGWPPSSGPGDENHTENLQGSTEKEPPLHQRRVTAGSSQGWKPAWQVKTEETTVCTPGLLLPPSGVEMTVTENKFSFKAF